MTCGRKCPDKSWRKQLIREVRERDGDKCCHCGDEMDFTITDQERPDFPTLEHWPIPWRICHSNDVQFLKCAHRYCNERSDALETKPQRFARFVIRWHQRTTIVLPALMADVAKEAPWRAHEEIRANGA